MRGWLAHPSPACCGGQATRRVRPSEMSGAEIWVGDPAAAGQHQFEIGNLRFENESGAPPSSTKLSRAQVVRLPVADQLFYCFAVVELFVEDFAGELRQLRVACEAERDQLS